LRRHSRVHDLAFTRRSSSPATQRRSRRLQTHVLCKCIPSAGKIQIQIQAEHVRVRVSLNAPAGAAGTGGMYRGGVVMECVECTVGMTAWHKLQHAPSGNKCIRGPPVLLLFTRFQLTVFDIWVIHSLARLSCVCFSSESAQAARISSRTCLCPWSRPEAVPLIQFFSEWKPIERRVSSYS